jgi:lysophospholipase L1-like esterase
VLLAGPGTLVNPLRVPVIAAQAVWVRSRTERLPPAGGAVRGVVPAPAGGLKESPEPLRIGILGESTAAGCGVETHDQGFPGALARTLAERVPALPKTLGRYLAGRAAAFDEVSRRVCADHASSVWLDARTLLPAGVEFFSRDRFHPSAFGYRRWAGAVADLVES